MRHFLSHFKHPKDNHRQSFPELTTAIDLPESFYNEQDIFRFRKQRGVNIGSWFVLERWITDAPFRCAVHPAQSDLDIAHGSNAKVILEEHWNTWITEADWAWLKECGFNAVRIPIGYYHLAGIDSSLLEGTEFQNVRDVFGNAWAKITEAFELAYRYHIGVLIDLHAAPGKQNADPHAGTSNSPAFFSQKYYMQHTMHILASLLLHLNRFLHTHNPPLPNFLGIELLNEPHPGSDTALQSWYATTIQKLRSIDATIPLYLGECWRLDAYADWLVKTDAKTNTNSGNKLIVLDHHLYRCFAPSDIAIPAEAHSNALDPETNGNTAQHFNYISEKLGRSAGGSGLIIGEWSGALNPGSLHGSTSGGREETKRYIEAQLRLYDQTCAGWFFWTFKKQYPGDCGWSLRDAIGAGTFPNRVGVNVTLAASNIDPEEIFRAKSKAKAVASDNHQKWWAQYPGGQYDHTRFDEGYNKGWDQALRFITFDLNGRDSLTELGFVRAWARRWTNDYGKNYWEYEHGFLQAVKEVGNFFKGRYGFS